MEKIKYKESKDIPLDKIYVSDLNVRTEEQYEGMEELVNSIKKFNLISPIIVIEAKNGKFELIVGQRRFLAFKQLKKDKIPAIIIESISDTSKRVVSFAENMHRRELNFHDTVTVCEALFDRYHGSKEDKISKIAQDIGISIKTVSDYLGYKLIPQAVQDLVVEGKLNKTQASKITAAFWPNTKKIVTLAKKLQDRTRSEWRRALTYTKKHGDASIKDILDAAEKPDTTRRVTIEIDLDHLAQLKDVAKKRSELLHRNVDTSELISEAVEDFLKKGGILDE